MRMPSRLGIVGAVIAAVASLSGVPFSVAGPQAEDGSKIMITSPKDGDRVSDTFDLKYELVKGTKAAHAHVFLDNEYQKGFSGTFKGVGRGKHQITVTGATKDHDLVAATHTITVDVQ